MGKKLEAKGFLHGPGMRRSTDPIEQLTQRQAAQSSSSAANGDNLSKSERREAKKSAKKSAKKEAKAEKGKENAKKTLAAMPKKLEVRGHLHGPGITNRARSMDPVEELNRRREAQASSSSQPANEDKATKADRREAKKAAKKDAKKAAKAGKT
ncbi:hypothetical protein F5Y18DRAFT_421666 [Xylariaceae sp. FL1019]|nr:hypothetical protein F5Y18DRAFT_421666 [Xylariaceae sp. FL1019]